MILRPWPMILRSFPITDFSPVEGALLMTPRHWRRLDAPCEAVLARPMSYA